MSMPDDDRKAKELIITSLRVALEECDKLNARHAAIDVSMAIEKMINFSRSPD